MSDSRPLPYGLHQLKTTYTTDSGPPKRVVCYVNGCKEWLTCPSKEESGTVCPTHGVRCHHNSIITMSYDDPCRNLITDCDIWKKRVRHNPAKVESHRFHLINSEDSVTWNVFRSLQQAELLKDVAASIIGRPVKEEPTMYLWGLSSSDNLFLPMNLLTRARDRFEVGRLPVKRPYSEMDICLHASGEFLILLEAKVLAPNPFVFAGAPRVNDQSLTFEEILHLYDAPCLRLIDRKKAGKAHRIFSQLFRYCQIADWMARQDSAKTQPYLCNLVRQGSEYESAHEMYSLLKPQYKANFSRLTWETIYALVTPHWARVPRLREYMLSKPLGTRVGFVPAFECQVW